MGFLAHNVDISPTYPSHWLTRTIMKTTKTAFALSMALISTAPAWAHATLNEASELGLDSAQEVTPPLDATTELSAETVPLLPAVQAPIVQITPFVRPVVRSVVDATAPAQVPVLATETLDELASLATTTQTPLNATLSGGISRLEVMQADKPVLDAPVIPEGVLTGGITPINRPSTLIASDVTEDASVTYQDGVFAMHITPLPARASISTPPSAPVEALAPVYAISAQITPIKRTIAPGVRLESQALALGEYARTVQDIQWSEGMGRNTAMTVKLQTYLDWQGAAPGAIDGKWGKNSISALAGFQAMRNLEITGRMSDETYAALQEGIDAQDPILVGYTISNDDVQYPFGTAHHYHDLTEMLAERFHMTPAYLKELNAGIAMQAGETVTVINAKNHRTPFNHLVVNKTNHMVFGYQDAGDRGEIVAVYPAALGTLPPIGTYQLDNAVLYPDTPNPHGANHPQGLVRLDLAGTSCSITGTAEPQSVGQAGTGCISLTNWNALSALSALEDGALVSIIE